MEISFSGMLVKQTIKKLLKSHDKTQNQLAEYLDLSLPSIKKLLNSEDIGFERLVRIANFFGLNVSDLMSMAFEKDTALTKVSKKQERFICSKPIYTKILKSLFCSFSKEEIKRHYSLSAKYLESRLREMEQQGLLTLDSKGSIQLEVCWPLKYEDPKAISMKRFLSWTIASMRKIISDYQKDRGFIYRFEYYCSDKTKKELESDMREIIEKYKIQASSDMKRLPKSKLNFFSAITAVGSFSGWDLLDNEKF